MKIKLSDHQMEFAQQHAELKERTLEPGEGYTRTGDGGWIIIEVESGEPFVDVRFHGTAKKNLYAAPDPEGFAIAQKIVELWNNNQ